MKLVIISLLLVILAIGIYLYLRKQRQIAILAEIRAHPNTTNPDKSVDDGFYCMMLTDGSTISGYIGNDDVVVASRVKRTYSS